MVRIRTAFALLASLTLIAACGERQVPLPGERIDIRPGLLDEVNEARPIALPAVQANADWTHRGGAASHAIPHPALPAALSRAFAVDIGEGDSRRARITADPVVAGGRVFTLDARATVTAVSTAGAVLWTRELVPASDSRTDASGGGLAVAGDTLYVTTGFGRLTALDTATGVPRWVQDMDAPGGSAPTVMGDLVYVVARDSRAWALDRADGRVRWTLEGIPSTANFAGGAGAAARGDTVVFPFPSGEVIATFAQGGLQRWASVIAGARPGQSGAIAATDISGDPVIDGDRVYVGNVSGRIVALRMADGDRIWTATEGAASPVWPVAGSVFAINDLNELLRLDAADGSLIWRVALPLFEDGRDRRRRDRFVHYGPVLAGGRLIVASSDGLVRQVDPVSGAVLGALDLPGGAASHPVVAGGTLYVVTKRGQLVAFR